MGSSIHRPIPFCIPGRHPATTGYRLVRASFDTEAEEWFKDDDSPAAIVVCLQHAGDVKERRGVAVYAGNGGKECGFVSVGLTRRDDRSLMLAIADREPFWEGIGAEIFWLGLDGSRYGFQTGVWCKLS